MGRERVGILSGYTEAHRQVEQDLAWFMNEESAISLNAVWMPGGRDRRRGEPAAAFHTGWRFQPRAGSCAVFFDRENHASLLDAVRLARPGKATSLSSLRCGPSAALVRRSSHQRKLVTDGYFSMSARVAPLGQIAEIC